MYIVLMNVSSAEAIMIYWYDYVAEKEKKMDINAGYILIKEQSIYNN